MNSIKHCYNRIATQWNERYENPVMRYRQQQEEIIISQYIKKGKILDLGCGTGKTIPFLKKFSHNVIGIDISKQMLRQAKTHDVKLYCTESTNLPLKDKSIDTIISLYGPLQHTNNPKVVLTEIKRVLKENGIIILSLENRKGFLPFMRRLFKGEYGKIRTLKLYKKKKVNFKKNIGVTLYYYTPKELYQLFKESKLKIITIRGVFFLLPPVFGKKEKELSFLQKILITLDKILLYIRPLNKYTTYLYVIAKHAQ